MNTKSKALALIVAAIISCSSLHAAQVADEAAIRSLADEASAVADKWLKQEPIAGEVRALKSKAAAMTYDVTNLPIVVDYMKKAKGSAKSLYVLNSVLGPLWHADAATAKAALVEFNRTQKKLAKYKQPMKYNLVMPAASGRTSPDAMMSALAAAQAKAAKNFVRLLEVKKYNAQVGVLNRTLFQLMIRSAEPKEDANLVSYMRKLEVSGEVEFLDVLHTISSNAKSLSRERAGVFYDKLLAYGGKVRLKMGMYNERSVIVVITSKGGMVSTRRLYTGVEILKTINALAPVAGRAKVSVPTRAEIQKYDKEEKARKKNRKRKR